MFSAFSSAELITHPALPTSGQSSISDTDYFGFETSAITTSSYTRTTVTSETSSSVEVISHLISKIGLPFEPLAITSSTVGSFTSYIPTSAFETGITSKFFWNGTGSIIPIRVSSSSSIISNSIFPYTTILTLAKTTVAAVVSYFTTIDEDGTPTIELTININDTPFA